MVSETRPTAADILNRSGLLLFAHGYADGNGAKLAQRLSRELGALDTFGEIAVSLSKESPTPDEVLATMESERVFIAPLQIGATRVAARMLPEFLDKVPNPERVVTLGPVGLDVGIVRLARDLIQQTMAEAGLAPAQTSVLVAAQGSRHEDGARDAARALVDALATDGPFLEVTAVFQRQEPFADRWRETLHGRDIVALPFFISGGHHEEKVMPTHLKRGGASLDGTEVEGRRVWLAPSIGGHSGLSRVVLDMALRAVEEGPAP